MSLLGARQKPWKLHRPGRENKSLLWVFKRGRTGAGSFVGCNLSEKKKGWQCWCKITFSIKFKVQSFRLGGTRSDLLCATCCTADKSIQLAWTPMLFGNLVMRLCQTHLFQTYSGSKQVQAHKAIIKCISWKLSNEFSAVFLEWHYYREQQITLSQPLSLSNCRFVDSRPPAPPVCPSVCLCVPLYINTLKHNTFLIFQNLALQSLWGT